MSASYQSRPVASTTFARFPANTVRRWRKTLTPRGAVTLAAYVEAAGRCRSMLPPSRMLGSLRSAMYRLGADEKTTDRAVAELARQLGFAGKGGGIHV